MSTFLKKSAERAAKTFVQAYLLVWTVKAGYLDVGVAVPHSDAFNVLFTLDNVKAGIVGVALSIATSVGSKGIGPDSSSPSVV